MLFSFKYLIFANPRNKINSLVIVDCILTGMEPNRHYYWFPIPFGPHSSITNFDNAEAGIVYKDKRYFSFVNTCAWRPFSTQRIERVSMPTNKNGKKIWPKWNIEELEIIEHHSRLWHNRLQPTNSRILICALLLLIPGIGKKIFLSVRCWKYSTIGKNLKQWIGRLYRFGCWLVPF